MCVCVCVSSSSRVTRDLLVVVRMPKSPGTSHLEHKTMQPRPLETNESLGNVELILMMM